MQSGKISISKFGICSDFTKLFTYKKFDILFTSVFFRICHDNMLFYITDINQLYVFILFCDLVSKKKKC